MGHIDDIDDIDDWEAIMICPGTFEGIPVAF
jgi:hypothetical protein